MHEPSRAQQRQYFLASYRDGRYNASDAQLLNASDSIFEMTAITSTSMSNTLVLGHLRCPVQSQSRRLG